MSRSFSEAVAAWWYGGRVLFHIISGVLEASLLQSLRSRPVRRRRIREWSRELLRLLGVRAVFGGCIPSADPVPAMVVANHISWMDIGLLNAMSPARFVAKADVGAWPFIGILARCAGSFFLRRGSSRDLIRVKDELRDALNARDTVAFFAEGTTTEGDRLLRFHSGLVESAVEAGVPVRPVAIRYAWDGARGDSPAAFVGEMTFLGSLLRVLRHRGLVAEACYAPLVSTEGRDRREVAAEAREVIARLLERPMGASLASCAESLSVAVQKEEAFSAA